VGFICTRLCSKAFHGLDITKPTQKVSDELMKYLWNLLRADGFNLILVGG